MEIESGNKGTESKSEKNFTDYIREIRNNFKNFLSDIFSAYKDNSQKLNNLKNDVTNNKPNKNNEKAETNNTGTEIKNANERINDSIENNDKNLKNKLKEICVRSRTY